MPENVFIKKFSPGEQILCAGDYGRNAYFIEKGRVEVSIAKDGKKLVIAELGNGEIFGEMSMIDDAPRSASVTAKVNTEVIVMERSRLSKPLFSANPIEHLLLRVLLARFRESQSQMSNIQIGASKHGVSIEKIRDLAFDRISKENDLRQALKASDLELHYQPIINFKSGEIGGFEALIRWKQNDKYVLPNHFIPLAEESGIICEIGHWILNHGLKDQKTIRSSFKKQFPKSTTPFMSINVSSSQLSEISETEKIISLIKSSAVKPEEIKLEITESLMISDPRLAKKILNKLKKTGISMTIDDFGTGYSSLSYLHQFPFDTLKIDQAFVKNMGSSKNSFRIINCIIQLAKALDLSIVAEGVETKKQMDQLKELGCQFGQGFYMAKPQPIHDILALIQSRPVWH